MQPARRRLIFLSAAIAAIAAVVALVLPAAEAPAAAASAAGSGVGSSHPGMIFTVGVSRIVSAGEGRRGASLQPYLVAGACVAAEDTADLAAWWSSTYGGG
jgi:Na+/melibiose symporter-like transporter